MGVDVARGRFKLWDYSFSLHDRVLVPITISMVRFHFLACLATHLHYAVSIQKAKSCVIQVEQDALALYIT